MERLGSGLRRPGGAKGPDCCGASLSCQGRGPKAAICPPETEFDVWDEREFHNAKGACMRRNPTQTSSCFVLLLISALQIATVPQAARGTAEEKAPQASGKVESKGWTFEARGAYAFPAEVGFDDEPGIKVAISNAGFLVEALDRDYDREHMIDTFFRDDETLVAYFQFSKSGAYKGVSYYFASGDGCGLCYDSSVQSTVKVEKGRIHGALRIAAKPCTRRSSPGTTRRRSPTSAKRSRPAMASMRKRSCSLSARTIRTRATRSSAASCAATGRCS